MNNDTPKKLTGVYKWFDVLIHNNLEAYDDAFKDILDLEDKLARSDEALSILVTAIESVQGKIDLKPKVEITCYTCCYSAVRLEFKPCKDCKDYSNYRRAL